MSRPFKNRMVCCEPFCKDFRPDDIDEEESSRVIMTVDEFETIRLIDFEGITQEQCAAQMKIARSTVQNIYDSARKKLSQCLVLGLCLHIQGGNYSLCDGSSAGYGCRRCTGQNCTPAKKEQFERNMSNMKIAVTYDPTTGEVFQHFGKTEYFKVYDIEDGKVVGSEVCSTNGQGHGALAGVLSGLGAGALICGGIGGGAQNALSMMGIQYFNGVTGSADEAAAAFAAGNLSYDPDAVCHHHDHDEGGCDHHHHDEGGCDHDHDEEGHSCCHS